MKSVLPFIRNKKYFVITTLFINCLMLFYTLAVVPHMVLAVSTKSIDAYPTHPTDADPRTKSWFIYDYPAGVKRTDSVTVVNTGSTQMVLRVYPVDEAPASGGSFALAQENAPKKGIGSWVKLSTSQVTLAPGQRMDIPFTITIPAGVMGEHNGGIVFQEVTPKVETAKNGMHINIISRVGVRIYETVPGSGQLQMKMKDFSYSVIHNHLNFVFTAEATGKVNIKPTGVLIVKDLFGRVISTIPLNGMLDTFVPGKPLSIAVPTQILLPIIGWDTAQVALYYSPTQVASSTITVIANPWVTFWVALIILLIISVLIFRKKLIKSVRSKKETTKVTLAPHVWMYVIVILVLTVGCSALIAYLFTFFVGGK